MPRIVFGTAARGGLTRMLATFDGTERNHNISFIGPLYNGTYSGYTDIQLIGLNCDIEPLFPSWAPFDGVAWDQCTRIALLNSFFGYMAYGCVPINTVDFVAANCNFQRTSSAGSSGNKHLVRTEHSSRVAIVDNKLDHTLDVPGANGTALRFHHGGSLGAVSQYNLAYRNAMEAYGNLQCTVNNSGTEGFNGSELLADVTLQLNSYRRLARTSNGQSTIAIGNDAGENGNVYRNCATRLSMVDNEGYVDPPYDAVWQTTTPAGSTPADWGAITGNQSDQALPHQQFDDWAYRQSA